MKSWIVLAGCMLLNITAAVSQTTDDFNASLAKVTPLSPNAAALVRYSDMPVSTYSGVPQVSVPIYTVQSGSLQLPISLSYHGGGVKVEDAPSWVGCGWTLNAGGAITRSIRGLADETGYFNAGQRDMMNAFINSTSAEDRYQYYATVTEQGTADFQPDVFNYQAGDESAKFFCGPDGQMISKPRNRTRFELLSNTTWKITRTDGTMYYYEAEEEASNVTSALSSPGTGSDPHITAWYLTKIVSAQHRDSIMLEYDTETQTNYATGAQTRYYNKSGASGCNKSDDLAYNISYITAMVLKKITFNNGSVVFTRATTQRSDLTGGHALQSIALYNNAGGLVRQFTLHTHFAGTVTASGVPAITQYRLFLDSVSLYTASLTKDGVYRMEYNAGTLPNRVSPSQDFWGYYNGASASTSSTFLPYCFAQQINADPLPVYDGVDKTPYIAYAKIGSLSKLYYPTGGYTQIDYESNTVSNFAAIVPPGYDLKDETVIVNMFGDATGTQTSYSTSFTVARGFGNYNDAMGTITMSALPGTTSSGSGSTGVGIPVTGASDPIVQLKFPNGTITNLTVNRTILLPVGNYTLTAELNTGDDPPSADYIKNFFVTVQFAYGVRSNPTKLKNLPLGGLRVHAISNYDPFTGVTQQRVFNYLEDDGVTSTGVLSSFPYYEGSTAPCINGYNCPFLTLSSVSQVTGSLKQGGYVGYYKVEELFGANGENGKNRYYYSNASDIGNWLEFPYAPPGDLDELRGQLLHQQTYRKETGGTYTLITEKWNNYDFTVSNNYKTGDSLSVSSKGVAFGSNATYYPVCSSAPGSQYTSYTSRVYGVYSGFIRLLSDSTVTYDPTSSGALSVANFYNYSEKALKASSVTTARSDGAITLKTMQYALDYGISGTTTGDDKVNAIVNLVNNNMVDALVEHSEYVTRNGVKGLVKSLYTTYKPALTLPDKIYTAEKTGVLTDFAPASYANGSITIDSRYQPRVNFLSYTANGKPASQQMADNIPYAYLWDYNGDFLIAEVTNATPDQVAYTSFEADATGNWNWTGSVLTDAAATGNKAFNGSVAKTVPLGDYIASVWVKQGSSATVNSVSGTLIATKNGWSLYRWQLQSVTSIQVAGSDMDEVRLYPAKAQMATYTFDPLNGMTTATDVADKTTYYLYDGMGRLSTVKDLDGNVLKTMDYKYATKR